MKRRLLPAILVAVVLAVTIGAASVYAERLLCTCPESLEWWEYILYRCWEEAPEWCSWT